MLQKYGLKRIAYKLFKNCITKWVLYIVYLSEDWERKSGNRETGIECRLEFKAKYC